jgi:SAM-dependent methyltransferase
MFEAARLETLNYHRHYYGKHQLFDKHSWLAGPDIGLMKLIEKELNSVKSTIRILDLGSGVGRNAVPMAMALKRARLTAEIVCVDVLTDSIEILKENSLKYGVDKMITAVVADNDDFVIAPESFDLIAAISVIEHCAGKANVLNLLNSVARGLKNNGLVRLEMTTDRNVVELDSKEPVASPVETPLTEIEVRKLLSTIFSDFAVLSLDVFPYEETIERNGKTLLWRSTQVNFSAKKRSEV